MNDGDLIFNTRLDTAGLKSGLQGAGGEILKTSTQAAAKIGEISLAAAGAATAAIAALSKSAIECYGDYEQIIGGVETLFKDSADVIKGYSEEAFRTVGMSANEYMETVTGFSASLISSMGNDTEAAAEKANTALSDMSDNANKMGSDLESIKNAYSGFSKQNYTMLDNLKIGYGGTKSEMERLLADAEKLQKSKGIDVSYDISSFADIVDAIHVIQTEMDITGTTAKEASSTIQGSISAAKAAWQNLLTGMSDPTQDFDKLLNDVVESVVTVSDNLAPRIMAVLPTMATGITELTENLLPLIPETVEQMLPSVIDGANSIVSALLNTLSSFADTAIPIVTENADEIIGTLISGIVSAAPNLAGSAAQLCTSIAEAILSNADIITEGASDIVTALADGISDNLDSLIPSAIDAALTVAETILDNADKLSEAAASLIDGLANGITASIPILAEKAPDIVSKLFDALVDSSEILIDAGVDFCTVIADELIHYDWSTAAEQMMLSLSDAVDNAQKHVMLGIDNLLGGDVYGGDINNVASTAMVGYMRDGIDDTVQMIEDGQKAVSEAYDKGMQEINEHFGLTAADMSGKEWLEAEAEREANAKAVLEREKKRAEEWKKAQENSAAENQSAAEAISEQRTLAETAAEQMNDEELKNQWQKLDHEYAMGIIADEDALYQKRLELLGKYGDESNTEHWGYYEKLRAYEQEQQKKALDDQEDSQNKAIKSAGESLDDLNALYQKKYSDMITAQSDYRSRLMAVGGSVFSVEKETDEDGNETTIYKVNDIEKQIAAMEKYHADIKALKEDGASSALLEELNSMSAEDGAKMAEYLAGMSEEERQKVIELYKRKEQIADDLSADLYAKDAENMQNAFAAALTDMGVNAYDSGVAAAEQFASGFSGKLSELMNISAFTQVSGTVATEVSYRNAAENSGNRNVNVNVEVTGGDLTLDSKVCGEYSLDYTQSVNVQKGR
nr:MAG TPA: tail tape measure protein [Caudoviricetes sp.]